MSLLMVSWDTATFQLTVHVFQLSVAQRSDTVTPTAGNDTYRLTISGAPKLN